MSLLTKTFLLFSIVGGLLAASPRSARAETYPRDVVIDGKQCIEEQHEDEGAETWCYTATGQLEKVSAPPPSPASQEPSLEFAQYSPPPPAGGLSSSTAEALSSAALKYSWSGPLKWSAVSSGTFALLALTNDDLRPAAAPLLLSAGLSLTVALILDASARADTARAARQQW